MSPLQFDGKKEENPRWSILENEFWNKFVIIYFGLNSALLMPLKLGLSYQTFSMECTH